MGTTFSSISYSAWPLILLTLAFLSNTSSAATTAYMSSTEQLDLRQVQFVVVAPAQLQESLHRRALALFTEAGLPIPGSLPSQTLPSAILTLTLDPRPIDVNCPGKTLYAPSLTLIEPVTIPRTGSTIRDTTWLIETGKEVSGPVSDERINADLDDFIRQFISDYQTANRQLQDTSSTLDVSVNPQSLLPSSIPHQQVDQDLRKIQVLSLSVLAGQWSSALKAIAARQLTKAGLRVVPNAGGDGVVSLSLELTQRGLDEHCPGKVLYERGLYLVEQVSVTRRPLVLLWSDTWLRESIRVVPPLSLQKTGPIQRLSPYLKRKSSREAGASAGPAFCCHRCFHCLCFGR